MGCIRILGIDYGDARIGLAFSETGFLASPLTVYKSVTMRKDIDAVAAIAARMRAELIVLGLPLNMDGSEGERASKTRAFGRNLEKVSGLRLEYEDERLTSVEADDILKQNGKSRQDRAKVIDAAAAQLILQSYLDKNNKNSKFGGLYE